ncbi:hypothetical protein Pla8534_65660 [Lignipirellula cremea]|uniref:Uncharacterized protein n=2 Tax=Lignipirellula cremea TaxID=2528010 RepID=A0A518E3S6_9BACT|nr:hypothetical protein Pla8534_65660 [Lignipirellula cremea]
MHSNLSKPLLFILAAAFVLGNTPSLHAQRPYNASYRADKQGSYDGVRFIYVDYQGPANAQLWAQAFSDISRHCIKENITHRKGGDGDWFPVRGLSNSRQVIVGYVNDKNQTWKYVVIHRITPTQVQYLVNGTQPKAQGRDPGNFEKMFVGSYVTPGNLAYGTPDAVTKRYAAIQIWKHGHNEVDAGVTFRFLAE